MKVLNAQYFMWFLHKVSQKLGFWGLLATIILLASLFLLTSKVLPMQQEVRDLSDKIQYQLSKPKKIAEPVIIKPEINMAEQVAMFYDRFPDVETLPNWLGAIDDAAITQKLALNRGDYKLNKVDKAAIGVKDHHLTRYEIMLPVKGSYIQIRKFIATILQQLPMLALSDFQITREHVSASTVEANLLFVLFLQERS